jgi:hypothetical protein
MMHVKEIGSYLGRPVRLASISRPTLLPGKAALSNAAVAILWTSDRWSVEERRKLLDDLFEAGPVVIALWGNQADGDLDAVLDLQSARAGDPHVMTYLLSSTTIAEAMWEFLHVVIPSPKRTSEWKDYAIICVGGDAALMDRLEAALQATSVQATTPINPI